MYESRDGHLWKFNLPGNACRSHTPKALPVSVFPPQGLLSDAVLPYTFRTCEMDKSIMLSSAAIAPLASSAPSH